MYRKTRGIVLFFLIVLALIVNLECTNRQENKIPLTTSSNKARTLFLKGRDLHDRLHYKQAYDYFKKATEEDTSFALAFLYASITAPTSGLLLENINHALSLKDNLSEGEQLLIQGVREGFSGNMVQQQDYFQKLVSLYPEDERAHNLLGNSYFSQQDYNQAIGEYRRATQINPDFSPPYNQLGYSHKYLKNYEEAKEAFQQYIKLIPEDPNPYDSYAELLMKTGKFESSIEVYRKALKTDPTFINSYIGIATNLNFLQKYEDARNELSRAMEQATTDEQKWTVLYAKSVSYLYEGKYDEALEVLATSFQMMTSLKDTLHMSETLNNIGRIYLEQRKTDQALSKYMQSNELINASSFPKEMIKNRDEFFTLILAYIDLIKGNFVQARQKADLLGESSELPRNRFQSWNYHQLLGSIAYREKNYDYAIGEFQRSNLQNPYNLYRIALAYLAKNDKGKTREFVEMAANHNTFNSMEYAFIRQRAIDLYENLNESN